MSLLFHLSLHVFLALLAGFFVWLLWRRPVVSFAAAFLGGVLIDLDHLIDYFLAFGLHFRLDYFLQGYQFLKSDKLYVLFHGWEYVVLLAVLAFAMKSKLWLKSAILSLSLGMFFHLLIDVNINDGMTLKGYSVFYRTAQGFEIQEIMTPEHYKDHQLRKQGATFLDEPALSDKL
ncbi:MAG: hypothetical protein A2808_01040 [Candidatus Moranbacteria bacterium RIFCSPHIGHO2_01_FULL_55_24]|nr:MAG: hypothetical protein A2808_01040 [Candidatus Moranbacteria bacterium RIFCSPHIGHO2_01_FULL_55_24]